MDAFLGFLAYPSVPSILGETIEAAVRDFRQRAPQVIIATWRANEIAGQFVGDKILDDIATSEALIADITRLNFNVTYEIGFAIGRRKRLLLVKNSALEPDADESDLGIFDTIGHATYQNSSELAEILKSAESVRPLDFATATINAAAPVYLLDAKYKTDQVTRIFSRVKKAKLFFRSFDPNEQPRLSALEAIRNVAQSHGVLVHLLPKMIRDARLHNLRAAFLAGLATGMEKVTTIIQLGNEPVPIDYRDFAVPCFHPGQIDDAVANFATDVAEAFQTKGAIVSEPTTFLGRLNFGASAAENELRDLGAYYLETDDYKRALRGDARMVIGRKGSGKTAIFFQVRDRIRQRRQNVVLDLKPDGYQLLKFKESILSLLAQGTYEHTITAFWEYLILLELCHKLLADDKVLHTRDGRLYKPYRELADVYATDEYIAEGDFSERMSKLIQNISNNYQAKYASTDKASLSTAQITELLYVHHLERLRGQLETYLKFKESVWILFDNLDRGWPARGIRPEDVTILRCLEDATRKIERQLHAHGIETHTLLFLRQDVYELLLEETPDRGKQAQVTLDWSDADMLREILKRRLIYNGATHEAGFQDIWRGICVSHVHHGEESAQYLIDRSLMRPRFLLNLVNYCRSFAVNLGHARIEPEDIEKGIAAYSDELVKEIGYEIRDISPEMEDVLYVFIDVDPNMTPEDLGVLLRNRGFKDESHQEIIETLLWYGALGIFTPANEAPTYIFNVNYNLKVLEGIIERERELLYVVNPAFWSGLAVKNGKSQLASY